jgi:hypothetical protein
MMVEIALIGIFVAGLSFVFGMMIGLNAKESKSDF